MHIQIKNKTDHYVTVITTPSLHKLAVIQLGNKINHRLFRKTKLHNSVPWRASMQCTQPYGLIPHCLNIYLRSILIISCNLRQVFEAYIQKYHRSYTDPSNSSNLRGICRWKCLSKQSPPFSKGLLFNVDWLRKFVFQARAACEQK